MLRAVPPVELPRRVYLPHGAPVEIGQKLRGEGWTTIAGLAPVAGPEAEARRLVCSHAWIDGAVVAL
ncbi:MAG: hypothetical protein WDN69_12650 [Aliidongia sp.]